MFKESVKTLMGHLLIFYFNFYFNEQKKRQQMSHPEVDSWEKKLAHGDALTNDAPASMEHSKQNVKKKHISQFHFGCILSYLHLTQNVVHL